MAGGSFVPAERFGETPLTCWTPDGGYTDVGFLTVGGGDYDPGEHYWTTMDMNGDSKPDLIISAESGRQYGELGDRHWLVFPATP